MSGPLAFDADPIAVAALFGVVDVPIALKADYKVAPCEAISVIAATEPFSARPENGHRAADGSRRLVRARWGLVCGQASVQFDDEGTRSDHGPVENTRQA